MTGLLERLISTAADKRGNVGLLAAASAPVLICSLALGVDYGHLTLERRALQQTSDLAAIVAAGNLANSDEAVLNYFALNNKNFAIRDGDRLLTLKGTIPFNQDTAFDSVEGYAMLTKGRYNPDPAQTVEKRFVAGLTPYDAVAVTTVQKTRLFFGGSIASAPQIYTKSRATMEKVAAFSIGSRLASLNGGILNQVLGSLLGTEVTLSVMDYNALLDADVNAFKFADALATELNLTAATYQQVLDTEIGYGTFLTALAHTGGLAPSVTTVVQQLENSLDTTELSLSLGDILSLDPYRARRVGSSNGLIANAKVFDLINAAATAANGGRQVSVDLGASVPGLASITLDLAIGEPPVGTPPLAVGAQGSIVRTAQTRARITASVDGLSKLAGMRVELPLYLEVATAEAALSDIACLGGSRSNATVKVKAVPGVAEIALGNVDTSAFANFGSKPRVEKAVIVNSALLKISALGHVEADNMSPDILSFEPRDIQAGKVKSVSTRDTLTSLTTSLLGNLELDIKVLFLTLGTPKAVQTALADTLATVTEPLDSVLYNTLLALGIRIGEADIRVTGVTCQRPVLVQ